MESLRLKYDNIKTVSYDNSLIYNLGDIHIQGSHKVITHIDKSNNEVDNKLPIKWIEVRRRLYLSIYN